MIEHKISGQIVTNVIFGEGTVAIGISSAKRNEKRYALCTLGSCEHHELGDWIEGKHRPLSSEDVILAFPDTEAIDRLVDMLTKLKAEFIAEKE